MTTIKERFAVAPTAVLHLRDASDEPMYDDHRDPITVTLFGPGSPQYKEADTARHNRLVDLLKRKGRTEQTAKQRVLADANFLCGVTKEFSANFQLGKLKGKALIRAAYMEPDLGFIPDQVNRYLGDWGNFSKAPASPGKPAVREKNPLLRVRTFKLVRDEDETGISGTGVVAEGVEFSNGMCAMSWLTAMHSVAVYPNVRQLEAIHGHNGRTVVRFDEAA